MFHRGLVWLVVVCGFAAPAWAGPPAEATKAADEFFESRVRPILAENCWECHGPKKQELGLRLDSREAVVKGGDTGAVVVVGDAAKSSLIAAINHAGDTKMPPKKKLAPEQIAALTDWVQNGLHWPQAAAIQPAAPSAAAHWSLQPITRREPPAVKDAGWVIDPLDRFILAGLEAKGLAPSSPADRRTWLRRVTFDLTGLPPTPEDVDDFLADQSADAFEKVVDRLLASPRYGERWGRHWLDVARYADTKGYVFTEEKRYPFSYTYRDYVIRAFNEDLPYDRFVLEQLAADLLPPTPDNRSLAALGFLTIGKRFMNNTHDIIDDRIDVVGRGLMGLTVGCARCHDHKYDPIPQADYYSLYGVFAGCREPAESPQIGLPTDNEAYAKYKAELERRQRAFDEFRDTKNTEFQAELRGKVTDYLIALAHEPKPDAPKEEPMRSFSPGEVRPRIVARWRGYVRKMTARPEPVFAAWRALADVGDKDFAAAAGEVLAKLAAPQADPRPNPLLLEALSKAQLKSFPDVAKVYGEVLTRVDQQWTETLRVHNSLKPEPGKPLPPPPTRLADAAAEELRQVLHGESSPVVFQREEVTQFLDRSTKDKSNRFKIEIDRWQVQSPGAPARAMVLNDNPTPYKPHIFVRGNPGRPGAEVPRQFLAAAAGSKREPFKTGSGRLELAQAVVARENPLTSRVWVNRVWRQHFGLGIVRTPSDFGARGAAPSHPELLDYLAAEFMADGWSTKKLHRRLLLSATYRQASLDRPEARTIDAENRWLWRMNRTRLEFEPLRDSLLAAAGRIDLTAGGKPVDLFSRPYSTRRTVYGLIDRNVLPGTFRILDFPSPDLSSPQRSQTTVPQQALFVMNSPFVVEQAKNLIARPDVAEIAEPARRVQWLHQLLYARPAADDEVAVALEFLQSPPVDPKSPARLAPWEQYAQALLLANEFVFVD